MTDVTPEERVLKLNPECLKADKCGPCSEIVKEIRAAVEAETERVLGRFALRGELEEMTGKRHRVYAAEVIQQVIDAARAALPAKEPADD